MGVVILIILFVVAMGSYILFGQNKPDSKKIYNLYEGYKKKGLDVEYRFPEKDGGCVDSVIENKSFKKGKIYKLIFYKEITSKDNFQLELCNKHKYSLSENDYELYFYNTKFCFIVLKQNFCGNVYFRNKTPIV